MKQKLDPRLQAMLERPSTETEVVDVLVALDIPLLPALREELQQSGLALRTVAGAVLTGSLALTKVPMLAALPYVVMIELSSPLYLEEHTRFEQDVTE